MRTLLLVLVLVTPRFLSAQVPTQRITLKDAVNDFPRSQLQLKVSGPVSLDIDQGARAGYQALAGIAGLNVIFDRDFRDTVTTPFRIENAGVLDAFDMISMRTGSFVEVLDSNSIIVAPDNPTKRREYEVQVIKTFYLPDGTTRQRLSEIVTGLRTSLGARYVAINTIVNAIVMRDTPERILLAEKNIASSTQVRGAEPIAFNAAGRVFITEAGRVQRSTPARPEVQLKGSGAQSFDMNENFRVSFQTLARAAGLNIVFDRDFRNDGRVPFRVENVALFDALDLLAPQAGSFWEWLDSNTILVSADNQTKRREIEPQVIRTFYLSNTTQQELFEIVTTLRTLLNCRFLAIVGSANAIVIRDDPATLALAEKIIGDVVKQAGALSASTAIPTGAENSFILTRRSVRSSTADSASLQPKMAGPFSFEMNEGAARSYEMLALRAGLNIAFDRRFQDGPITPLRLDGVGILDALDFLSLQTGNIWEIGDSDTIIVGPDNQTVRRDFERRIQKTISPTYIRQNVHEAVLALRTLLGLRQVDESGNTIVIEDTPYNIALAEKVISDLDRSPDEKPQAK